MSDVGQAIGTVVGGAIGFAIGGPSGALKGASLGYSLTAPKPEGVEDSPTYGFGTRYNTTKQNIPVPVVYGRNVVAGNTIYKSVSGEDDENMVMQVAVSEGPIESITEIKADEVDISNQCVVRKGTKNQTAHYKNDVNQTFPFTAYVTADLEANEEISGNPTITSVVKGRKVDVWDGSNWINQYSRNPAYCLLDFLTNKRYGLGIDKDKIDLNSFISVANYCDEKVDGEPRFRLDYVMDTRKSSLDYLQEILATFRSFLIYSSGELRLKADKEEEAVQSFDMDNIVIDSFSYNKTSKDDRYNQVIVEYTEPSENWSTIGAQFANDSDISQRGIVEKEFQLMGINRFEQAGRLARFYQKKSKYCSTFASWKAGIDSLHCEVGDIVKVSHDLPGWVDKKFRILEISEEENDEMRITAQEHYDAIYSDDGVVQQVKKDTTLPNPFEAPAEVKDISLSEFGYLNQDGTHIANIDLTFKKPNDIRYEAAKITVSKNGGNYQHVATIEDNEYRLSNVQTNANYRIKIQSVSGHQGIKSKGVYSNTLTVTGKDNKPPDVANLIVAQDDGSVLFKWEQVEAPDITGYEIREGSDWDSGRLIGAKIPGEYYRSVKETDGTKRYMIKALDRGGNYSHNAAVALFTVEDSGNKLNIINARNELADGAGTYNGLAVYDGEMVYAHNLSFADYPDLSFETAEANLTFSSIPEIQTHAEYISDAIDTNKIGRTGIRLSRNITATDADGSMSSIPNKSFADYSQFSFDEPPALYNFKVYIKFSDDNSTWTGWQEFVSGQYKFRYCQFKLVLESESETAQINIDEFKEFFDVPDIVIEIEEYSLSADKNTINFSDYGKDLYEKPKRYHASILNDSLYPVFSNVSADSLDIELKDTNGNTVSGTANIYIQGY